MKTLGFIGMGNMAQAIAAGFVSHGLIEKENVFAYAPHQDKLQKNAEKIGFVPMTSVLELVEKADTIVMACKPYQIEGVLAEVKDALAQKTLISIAAGWDFAHYQAYVHEDTRVQFIMPNTPVMVGEGVLLFEETNSLQPEEREELKQLFGAVGLVCDIPSHLMGIAGAVSGCGPAFVDVMMEAFGDAGVMYGLPRKTAYELVAKTFLGSAKLQLDTDSHPGVLKDAVCSPAGTTICGVAALEQAGARAACIEAISAVMNKKR